MSISYASDRVFDERVDLLDHRVVEHEAHLRGRTLAGRFPIRFEYAQRRRARQHAFHARGVERLNDGARITAGREVRFYRRAIEPFASRRTASGFREPERSVERTLAAPVGAVDGMQEAKMLGRSRPQPREPQPRIAIGVADLHPIARRDEVDRHAGPGLIGFSFVGSPPTFTPGSPGGAPAPLP